MTTVNVQFSNSNESAVVTYFSSPQSSSSIPNSGTIDTSDPRWEAFYNLFSSNSQAYLPAPTTGS